MAWLIFLALIGVPIAEIAVFIELGGLIGLWPTLTLIIVTALLGTVLLRHQGLRTLRKAQESLARNEVPVKEAMDGHYVACRWRVPAYARIYHGCGGCTFIVSSGSYLFAGLGHKPFCRARHRVNR